MNRKKQTRNKENKFYTNLNQDLNKKFKSEEENFKQGKTQRENPNED